ncbi:MAG: hypothetical protein LQ348_005119, partial [Seirophora lacunosa]
MSTPTSPTSSSRFLGLARQDYNRLLGEHNSVYLSSPTSPTSGSRSSAWQDRLQDPTAGRANFCVFVTVQPRTGQRVISDLTRFRQPFLSLARPGWGAYKSNQWVWGTTCKPPKSVAASSSQAANRARPTKYQSRHERYGG